MTDRNRCPLDGGIAADQGVGDNLLVCDSCHELLTRDELVDTPTHQTAHEYMRRYGYLDHPDYQRHLKRL